MKNFMMIVLITCILSFMITYFIYPVVIPFLHKIKFGQSIREEGPKSHLKKSGTPTMGGIVFICTSLLVGILMNIQRIENRELLLVLIAFIGFGLIGFLDDFLIVVKKNNDGLRPRYKLLLQVLVAIVFYLLYASHLETSLWIPLFNIHISIGKIGYFFFILFMFAAESNATNLTDGLDGLLGGCACIVILPFLFIAYLSGHMGLAILLVAVEGSLLAYLKFNVHPAKIFMGDAGSLALGGLLAATAMVLKVEFLLVIAGGLFVIEELSVVLQVLSFKLRKKRIFKMAPIHHHFELSGWSEQKVVYTFWAISALLSLFAFFIWYVQVY